jgi:hypothetical protein
MMTEKFTKLNHITIMSALIVMLSGGIYLNTLNAGYVWDDRAAIVNNDDIHSQTSIREIFNHDFWGQDIQLGDSHKSYRPVTVLSFRFNYLIFGLNNMGFHLGNIIIYMLCCLSYYRLLIKLTTLEGMIYVQQYCIMKCS